MINLTPPPLPLLTPEQAAARLSVSVQNFHQIAGRNRKWLPKVKLGHKTVRYRNEDLDRYIAFRVGELTDRQGKRRDVIGVPTTQRRARK